MIWSDMLLVGNGKLTTSKSKSSTLLYFLVINLFSSIEKSTHTNRKKEREKEKRDEGERERERYCV